LIKGETTTFSPRGACVDFLFLFQARSFLALSYYAVQNNGGRPLFGTLKGRPAYPQDGFEGHVEAYAWVRHFVDWYNHRHLHSGLKYVTPHQRHTGADREILSKRHQVYQQAMRRDPQRWSGATRNWSPAEATVLNPGKSIKGSRAATGAA